MSKALSRELAPAAALAGVVLLGATSALAHAHLLSSTPSAGSLTERPTTLNLRFSEGLVGRFTCVTLTRDGGGPVKGVACSVGSDGKTLIVTLKSPLTHGVYSVAWHAVATDTHRTQGTYTFSVR
jgi:hypothetical protein